MFLDLIEQRNPKLIQAALDFHQQGKLLPDTYIIDGDAFTQNAKKMSACAQKNNVSLYAMTKQVARIPVLAQRAIEAGFSGVVCVDFTESLHMARAGVKLGNVGHLVQIPTHALDEIIAAKPEVVTVYSLDKIRGINQAAKKTGSVQPLLIKVLDQGDVLYPQQEAGFNPQEFLAAVELIESLDHVAIGGVTHFPCFLLSNETHSIQATTNTDTVHQAVKFLTDRGYQNLQVNLPSSTCCASIPMIAELEGTHGEPGHGLTGTTPYHNHNRQTDEIPAIVYLSEVSHHYQDKSFCYAGGHYRRSGLEKALIIENASKQYNLKQHDLNRHIAKVTMPAQEAIDYHFELQGHYSIGAPVIMSFRTQMFVTRSQIAIIDGIQSGKPVLQGLYSNLGYKL